MMESAADGINFSDGNQLKRNSDYTTVLFFPPLDEKEILDSMEGKIGEIVTMGFDSEELPWQMIPRKRMQVLDAVRKLAGHVKRNQDVPQNVKFFITCLKKRHLNPQVFLVPVPSPLVILVKNFIILVPPTLPLVITHVGVKNVN